jgi:hypothetical protein
LHTEIQLLNPKLIVCLGGVPSSVLFGTDIKIKDIRGQIMWLGYWPILTTYSPNYVLKYVTNEVLKILQLPNYDFNEFNAEILSELPYSIYSYNYYNFDWLEKKNCDETIFKNMLNCILD